MSPAALASSELRVLLGEIDTARDVLGRLAEELTGADPGPDAAPSRERLALLAVDIHSWYTALESLLLRILTAFEGMPPSRDSSHALVLRAALRGVEGIRPPVLAEKHHVDGQDFPRRSDRQVGRSGRSGEELALGRGGA